MNATKAPKPCKAQRTRRTPARITASVAGAYRVDFETAAQLGPEAEGDGITEVVGKIIRQNDDARAETVAGKLHGYCVRSGRLAEMRRDLFDVCDENSQKLCNVASLVWNTHEHTYREELDLASPFGDLIVPWTITLLPAHRGKGIGLLALWRFIDYFGSGAALAVLKPFPLNHPAPRFEDNDYVQMQYDQFAKVSMKDGQAKLAAHWSRLGFQCIPDSDYFYLDMNCKRPSLEDLLQKERR